ncbi:MAG TPA: transposase, partial [Ktedonobacteraceae bacterium]|nr:transposase [Ktedonobacteraceae bacterium]
LYNALLAEAMKRLRRMKTDPAWQAARSIPRSDKSARKQVFTRLRAQYGFSEYGLHEAAKRLRTSWLAEHIDSLTAQKLASRAYQSANRVCVGEARRVRFRSKGRGLDSVEGKTNTSGLRFHLQAGADGNQGWLSWNGERIPALIDWQDEVIHHGLQQRIKYVRLLRQPASSPQARGADSRGFVYAVQLILEGYPLQKPKNIPGKGAVGLDLGPSTLAIVPEVGPSRLLLLAEGLAPDARTRRRLQRHLERQRRANNLEHYDTPGRIKKRQRDPQQRVWRESQGYQRTRRRLATTERKLAAQRRSLHGHMANQIIRLGDDLRIEKVSYKGWQRCFGRSVGLRAPGRFVDAVKCVVARTRTAQLHEIPTVQTKLSQYCHRCGNYTRKPLSQRFHNCPHCGLGSDGLIQRDLYSAWLASVLDPIRLTFPSRGQLGIHWHSMEACLSAALEATREHASAQGFLRRFGIPGV